jgi:hypothetical protein
MKWITAPGVDLGYLPDLISEDDIRPVKEQLDDKYRYGGGWRPMKGFSFDKHTYAIKYPGDPLLRPIAQAQLRDEKIFLYEGDWLMIVQPDSSYEIARVS